eukprot:5504964-Amphidinium_carterae.3
MCVCALPLSWSKHRDVEGMLQTVEMLRKSRPRMALIENVLGFSQKGGNEESSPLDWFLKQLDDLYVPLTTELDLGYWHSVTRKRYYIMLFGKECGGDKAAQKAQHIFTFALRTLRTFSPVPVNALLLPDGSTTLSRMLYQETVKALLQNGTSENKQRNTLMSVFKGERETERKRDRQKKT